MTTAEKLYILTGLISRKDLSRWCVFVDKYHWENSDALQYNTIIHLWDEHDWLRLVYYNPDFYESLSSSIRMDFLFNERSEYRSKGKNEWELRFEIIWHPVLLSDVLVWLEKNDIEVDIDWKWLLEMWSNINEALERDLTKPYLSEQDPSVIDWLFEVSLLIKNNLWNMH